MTRVEIGKVGLERLNVYYFIKREHDYSNIVALGGFSEKEVQSIFNLLQRVRKNIEKDWDFVKRGNKRNY